MNAAHQYIFMYLFGDNMLIYLFKLFHFNIGRQTMSGFVSNLNLWVYVYEVSVKC